MVIRAMEARAHVENGKGQERERERERKGKKGQKRQIAYASRVYSLAAINT